MTEKALQISISGVHATASANKGEAGVLGVSAPDGTPIQLVFEPHVLEASITALQHLASDMAGERRKAGKSPDTVRSLVQKIEGFSFAKDKHRDDLLMNAVLEKGNKVSYAIPLAEINDLVLMLKAAQAKWGKGNAKPNNN